MDGARRARSALEPPLFSNSGFAMQTAIEFEQLVAAVGDAIIISDAKGNITLWNPAAERMFGFNQSETLLHSPEHEVTGIVSVIRDETSRFQEERNLRKRMAELAPRAGA